MSHNKRINPTPSKAAMAAIRGCGDVNVFRAALLGAA